MKLDKIIKIEEIGEEDSVDIEVSGDHLFYANSILTHNSNSDVEMTDISESTGTAFTADFMVALIRSEELDKIGQLMVKTLKSRYNDVNYYKRFVIGVEMAKFRLYNLEESEQIQISDKGSTDSTDSIPVFDRGKFKKNGPLQDPGLNFD